MTREDIIRMAREIATQCCNRMPSWQNEYAMSRIMELIDASAAAEREACAKVAERFEPDEKLDYVIYASAAIRARGRA